ncbi:DNA-directed RNA polymerase specialized sigma subunit, sigma24 homolog [[Clostridium] ultunense Esp]|nr:DNA-directed RNA polymerase specialized sigma subunit, sigma24 homolog [[Clostridium] ultunense Esp]
MFPTVEADDMEEARIMAWFIIGLRHEAVRLAKKQKRLQQYERLILNDNLQKNYENDTAESVDIFAVNYHSRAEVEENVFLQEALSLLTAMQKTVIIATILEGYSEQEVAKQLGISQPVVHRMKRRALKRLRKHYTMGDTRSADPV